jgi:shikimate O-hydroxycinnamoyltransferase
MILKAKTESQAKDFWTFSQLDTNCLRLEIKGLWLFQGRVNIDALQNSLIKTLDFYPHLSGRIAGKGINMNNAGVEWQIVEQERISTVDVRKNQHALSDFNSGLKHSQMIKGKAPLLSVQVTNISDGYVICVHCSHVCLDGDGFYSFVNNWSKLHRGETIDVTIEKALVLFQQSHTKEEVEQSAIANKWHKMNASILWQFAIIGITKVFSKVTEPIFISDNTIDAIKQSLFDKTGIKYGTHAILSALITRMFMRLNNANPEDIYSQMSVMDIRNRFESINQNYAGNAITTIPTPEFKASVSFDVLVEIIDNSIKEMLNDRQRFADFVILNMETANMKVPYLPLDLKKMNARKPQAIYINNMRRFPVYDVDFGTGKPIWTPPNDLSDIVKIWPTAPDHEKGVEIYIRGYLVTKIKRIKDLNRWIQEIIDSLLNN